MLSHSGPEERLLCSILARGLRRVERVRFPDEPIEWDKFLRLSDRHRVAPTVFRLIARDGAPPVPSPVLAALKQRHDANALSSLRLASLLLEVTRDFGRVGIPILPLKGVSLAVQAYGDLSARYCGDIDVLVAPENLREADAILRASNWQRISNLSHRRIVAPLQDLPNLSYHLSYQRSGSAPLELHFQLNPNPLLLPIDVPAVLERADHIMLGGHEVAVLPRGLNLCFLATHGARHNWKRLLWLMDVALLLDRASDAERESWVREAQAAGVAAPLVQGLVLAHAAFGAPLPEAARRMAASLRVRFMARRAGARLFRSLEDEPDEIAAGLDVGIRLYRMCMSPRAGYHWQEGVRGMQSLWARMTGRGEEP
jgi:hypothetical protein